jgi:hypothetical protein
MYIGAFMFPVYHLSSLLHKLSLEVALGELSREPLTQPGCRQRDRSPR